MHSIPLGAGNGGMTGTGKLLADILQIGNLLIIYICSWERIRITLGFNRCQMSDIT